MKTDTDNLDQTTDAELSTIFALEVAAWKKRRWTDRKGYECTGWDAPDGRKNVMSPPAFATSADAVLPLLQIDNYRVESFNDAKGLVCRITLEFGRMTGIGARPFTDAYAGTFARAACIALIRAKRASRNAGNLQPLTD